MLALGFPATKENPFSSPSTQQDNTHSLSLRYKMAPYPLPPTELTSREPIRILHPGYPVPDTLLSLPRVDRVAGTTTFGVHYGTTLLACQIIAGNLFDTGRLTLDQAGQRLVELLFDDILTEEVYYFMIGDGPSICSTPSYPIMNFSLIRLSF